MSAASSGSRRNRRGGVIEFEIGLFMVYILALDGAGAFGPASKM
jgi:hypothetical protein